MSITGSGYSTNVRMNFTRLTYGLPQHQGDRKQGEETRLLGLSKPSFG